MLANNVIKYTNKISQVLLMWLLLLLNWRLQRLVFTSSWKG